MLIRTALRWLTPDGPRARLSVLIFHRVHARTDPLFPGEPDAQRFEAMLKWVRHWFRVIPLDEAVRRLREGRLPERALCITFDDGYADNHDVAMPILNRLGLSATVFVATGYVGGGRMWNDTLVEAVRHARRETLALDGLGIDGLPDALALDSLQSRREGVARLVRAVKYLDPARRGEVADEVARRADANLSAVQLMMSPSQIRSLRASGLLVGAHTVTHPILARLPRADARREIDDSRSYLESLLGERVGLFAYPNGKPGTDYTEESVQLVRELGFDGAVSTAHGTAGGGADPFQIPRFTPWQPDRWRFGASLLRNVARSTGSVQLAAQH